MEYIKTTHSIYLSSVPFSLGLQIPPRVLNTGIRGYIRKLFPKLLRSIPGVKLETIGFDKDHLHIVMLIPPKFSIPSVMGKLKSQSASQLRKTFPWLAKVYWNDNIVWSPGYFVSSVSVDEETIKKYVELHGHQDSGQLQLKL